MFLHLCVHMDSLKMVLSVLCLHLVRCPACYVRAVPWPHFSGLPETGSDVAQTGFILTCSKGWLQFLVLPPPPHATATSHLYTDSFFVCSFSFYVFVCLRNSLFLCFILVFPKASNLNQLKWWNLDSVAFFTKMIYISMGSLDQAGLEPREYPSSAFYVLGLKAYTTMPSYSFLFTLIIQCRETFLCHCISVKVRTQLVYWGGVSVLSLYYVSKAQTQVIRLCDKHLNPLNYLDGLTLTFELQITSIISSLDIIDALYTIK